MGWPPQALNYALNLSKNPKSIDFLAQYLEFNLKQTELLLHLLAWQVGRWVGG
jgi:hypothetical protein